MIREYLLKLAILLGIALFVHLIYGEMITCPEYVKNNPTKKLAGLNCSIKIYSNYLILMILPFVLGIAGWALGNKASRCLYLALVALPFMSLAGFTLYVNFFV